MAKTIEGNGCVSTNAGKCQKGTKGFLPMTLLILASILPQAAQIGLMFI